MCNNKCNNCQKIVFVTEIEDADSYVQLTIPSENLCNNDKICFIIPSNITLTDAPKPIIIAIGEEVFGWLSKSGNFVYSDQIRNRRLYVGRVKTDSRVLLNERCNLFRSTIDLPVIPSTNFSKKLDMITKVAKGVDKK